MMLRCHAAHLGRMAQVGKVVNIRGIYLTWILLAATIRAFKKELNVVQFGGILEPQ